MNSGKKASKATQRRKGSANVKPVRIKFLINQNDAIPTSNTTSPTAAVTTSPRAAVTTSPTAAATTSPTAAVPTESSTATNSNNAQFTKPLQPAPSPHCYILSLLRFCQNNVATCYGCGGKYYETGTPDDPNDMVVLSKKKRIYIDPTTKERTHSSDFTSVYYHFNYTCMSNHDSFFNACSILVPDDLKPHLSNRHKTLLRSAGVML